MVAVFRCFFLIALLLSFAPARAAEPVTARVAMTAFDSLDPVSLPRSDWSARDVAENLFVGLTRYDPTSGQIQPALARAWNVSGDGLTWTFSLRSDVSWVTVNSQTLQVEPVRPVVATDFVYALRRACDPHPPNPAAHTVYIIAGCRKVANTSLQLADEPYIAHEVAVTAPNDQTLEIKLALPAPYFASIAALPELRPVPPEAIAKAADWTQPGTIMTDGPWAVATWSRGQQMTLVRNPVWPDKPAGNVDRITINFATSPDAALQQFTSGGADFARLDMASALSLRQTRPEAVITGRAQSVTVLGFSAERSAAANLAFRRAASQAIDREKLVGQVWPGLAVPLSQFTPADMTDTTPSAGFAPDAARAALVASGMPACKPPEKLQIMVDDQPQSTGVAQAILDQWQAVLGCSPTSFKITVMPLSTVQNAAHGTVNAETGPRPHLWIYTWTPDYADANAWIGDALHCQYGFLRPGIVCGDADKLVDTAASETDPGKRADAYHQAETAWFGPAGTFPVAPLYALLPATAVQPALQGVTISGATRFDLWTISR